MILHYQQRLWVFMTGVLWLITIEKKTFLKRIFPTNHVKIKNIFKLLTKNVTHSEFSIKKNFHSNMSVSDYQNSFEKIKKNIFNGDCYQVNLAQRFSTTYTGSTWLAYKKLREKNPAPFSVFMKLHNGSILSC